MSTRSRIFPALVYHSLLVPRCKLPSVVVVPRNCLNVEKPQRLSSCRRRRHVPSYSQPHKTLLSSLKTVVERTRYRPPRAYTYLPNTDPETFSPNLPYVISYMLLVSTRSSYAMVYAKCYIKDRSRNQQNNRYFSVGHYVMNQHPIHHHYTATRFIICC